MSTVIAVVIVKTYQKKTTKETVKLSHKEKKKLKEQIEYDKQMDVIS